MALDYAKQSFSRFGHSHVSSAHLILGLLTLRGGVGDGVLHRFGLSVQAFEGYLSSRRSSPEESAIQDGLPLGDSARLAIARAESEARARQHTYLGVEHLLLGILAEERGEASDLFASVHIDCDSMRKIIIEEIRL